MTFEIVGEVVELQLSEEEQNDCVLAFITMHLRPESKGVYQEYRYKEQTVQQSLYHAIVNENINDCIQIAISGCNEETEITDRFMEMCHTSCSKYVVEK
jgi:hypothetical protein